VEEIHEIKSTAEEFYKKLLGSSNMVFTADHVARPQQLLSPIISAERAALLDQNVSAEEIRNTIFSMPSNN
jgi:hypothetical protein